MKCRVFTKPLQYTTLWRSMKDTERAKFKAQRARNKKALAYGADTVVLGTPHSRSYTTHKPMLKP